MHKTGHQGANLALASVVSAILYTTNELQYIIPATIIIVALASTPDIDMKLPIKHRGITHTIWFIAGVGTAFGAATFAILNNPTTAAYIGVFGALGIFGHLLGDFITPMGVQPFYPLVNSYSLGVVRAGNTLANWGLAFVGLAACASVVWLAFTGQLPTIA